MKLTMLFTLLACILFSGTSIAAQEVLDKRVTLSFKNIELRKILQTLEEQTNVKFAYSSEIIQSGTKISVEAENRTLGDVLDEISRTQNITYALSGNIIVLSKTGKKKENRGSIADTIPTGRQQIVVAGKVQDESGQPLSGVSVTLRNGNIGTTTNESGEYVLNVPSRSGVLEFSFVSFATQEIPIDNRAVINVTLAPTQALMQDIVIVGYGTQKRANLTGAVSTVNFRDLENIPQSNTLNILQGRVPGISIVQPGGAPGRDGGEVNIRGVGTLNDATPLVIIDGVPSTLNDFGNLTPQEIADVTVLKDASSAAIYGARGANGVILVTTRQPKEGKMKINVSSYYSWQTPTYIQDFVQSWQWMELKNETVDAARYPQFAIENVKNGILTDTFHNARWMEEIFRTAPMSNYNLSLSGGTKNLSFQASLGYLNQEGILLGTSSNRYNYRSNVNARISSKLESGLNLWGYVRKIKEPFESPDWIIQRATSTWPVIPVKYSNGDWGVDYLYPGLNVNTQNPVLLTELGHTNEDQGKANIQSFLQFSFTRDFKIRTSLTYSYAKEYIEKFNPTYSFNNPSGTPAFVNNLNELRNQTNENLQLQLQTLLTYNKTIKNVHNIGLLGGHEYTDFNSRFFSASGSDLPTNNQQVLSRALSNITVGGAKQEWALQSFFGRMNYGFKNKYLLEGNLRVDGSSRFPEDNRYGFFPSFSTGWVLSEENFFDRLSGPTGFLNHLKVRGGWGKVGNDRIGNYTYNQQLNTGYYNYGGSLQTSAAVNNFANPAIRWESTTTLNLGLDASFFRNKLMLNFDVFDRLTDGILYRLPMPASFGTAQPAILNIGKVSN
ncbi:MAG TPA: SusC/RagA family TonB-linked outer membrane protein, partial [Flavisolibacter sp.]|nr:SusC/RagA family TonB-linked outer membrane protein [Flavisolibacter sp.]